MTDVRGSWSMSPLLLMAAVIVAWRQRLHSSLVRYPGEALNKHVYRILVIPARPPRKAEVLETQEQFPARAGIQRFHRVSWMPVCAGMTTNELVRSFFGAGLACQARCRS